MLKCFVVWVLALIQLYGCTGPERTRPDVRPVKTEPAASVGQPVGRRGKSEKRRAEEDMLHQVAAELFAHKIRKNGAHILCDQAAYRACFRVSRRRCLSELNSYNEQCFAEGLKSLRGYVNRRNVTRFGRIYSSCLLSKHLADHVNHYAYTAGCLRQTRLSRRRALKSLLR